MIEELKEENKQLREELKEIRKTIWNYIKDVEKSSKKIWTEANRKIAELKKKNK